MKAKRPGGPAAVDDATTAKGAMSDKREETKPSTEETPHKVDEKTQEDAATERAENGGYD